MGLLPSGCIPPKAAENKRTTLFNLLTYMHLACAKNVFNSMKSKMSSCSVVKVQTMHLRSHFSGMLYCRNLRQLWRTFIDIRQQDVHVKAWSTWRWLPKLPTKTTHAPSKGMFSCLCTIEKTSTMADPGLGGGGEGGKLAKIKGPGPLP